MTRSTLTLFLPPMILLLGGLGLTRVEGQREMDLIRPFDAIPMSFNQFSAQDVPISLEEQRVAGMDSYLLRLFTAPDSSIGFSLYVGYYRAQRQGRTIHSPKNCLPGAGWEPLGAGSVRVWHPGRQDSVTVNRYELANGPRQALVYYWYQGRGRVAWNEYAVKWELLRDKARWGRSEEALVRIVVPIDGPMARADSLAQAVAARVLPDIERSLPPVS